MYIVATAATGEFSSNCNRYAKPAHPHGKDITGISVCKAHVSKW